MLKIVLVIGERGHKIEDWRDRWSPFQNLFFCSSLSPNSPSLPTRVSLAQLSSKLSKNKIELLIVVYTFSLSVSDVQARPTPSIVEFIAMACKLFNKHGALD
jgi:hypothetical protein